MQRSCRSPLLKDSGRFVSRSSQYELAKTAWPVVCTPRAADKRFPEAGCNLELLRGMQALGFRVGGLGLRLAATSTKGPV